ncbi:MAG: helix-turn-helix transcriptional regulator [Acidobacteria bacterium]|nr:helix-turn-helix transcriptional regulator [Acidobacteriota bacterium]MBV9477074.1 helix-turn-helix transcriptional regulator [Acidobacteriota bacterium]
MARPRVRTSARRLRARRDAIRARADAGVHRAHFARVFRARFGCTPGELLRQLRVEHAQSLLASTDVPLAEIALAAGFSSQSHFTATFRAYAGVTPAAFRRDARDKTQPRRKTRTRPRR